MIKNTSTKKQKILAAVSAALVAGIIAGAFLTADVEPAAAQPETESQAPQEETQPAEGFALILEQAIKQLALQDEVDAQLLNEMDSGNYSFESPLVVTDPYGQSPLAAMVLFTSAEPLKISIHIDGKDTLADIDFTFDGYNTRHILPVYGLYADTENKIELTAEDKTGTKKTAALNIRTEPLPGDLSKNSILTDFADETKYQPGLNFSYGFGTEKAAFDAYGDYRWFISDNFSFASLYDYNGHYIFVKELAEDALFYETDPLGRIYKMYYAPYGVHHDIEEYKDGNLLVCGYSGDTMQDMMYEINTQTGEIQNTLDFKTVFQRSREDLHDMGYPDWFHLNAIVWDESRDKLILSARHQSLVAEISWPDGNIDWMLSSPKGWLPMFRKYLLTPVGDAEFPYGQHAPQILPDFDLNPDTIDLLLFDNGNQWFGTTDEEALTPELYSRMVHYRINMKEMTVEQIWEYGKEEGATLYSNARGSAERLDNGNYFGMFLVQRNNIESAAANYMEVDMDGQVVWEALAVSGDEKGLYEEYKAERMQIYNNAANDLQLGEAAQNLVPGEVYERFNIQYDREMQ